MNFNNILNTAKAFMSSHPSRKVGTSALSLLAGLSTLTLSLSVQAQTLNIPFISGIGCSIVQYLKGPLAVLIFILITIATLVIGMITKMDWAKIITTIVIFGIVIGIGSILNSNPQIASAVGAGGLTQCLQ